MSLASCPVIWHWWRVCLPPVHCPHLNTLLRFSPTFPSPGWAVPVFSLSLSSLIILVMINDYLKLLKPLLYWWGHKTPSVKRSTKIHLLYQTLISILCHLCKVLSLPSSRLLIMLTSICPFTDPGVHNWRLAFTWILCHQVWAYLLLNLLQP